jgi:hypothetical protein
MTVDFSSSFQWLKICKHKKFTIIKILKVYFEDSPRVIYGNIRKYPNFFGSRARISGSGNSEPKHQGHKLVSQHTVLYPDIYCIGIKKW